MEEPISHIEQISYGEFLFVRDDKTQPIDVNGVIDNTIRFRDSNKKVNLEYYPDNGTWYIETNGRLKCTGNGSSYKDAIEDLVSSILKDFEYLKNVLEYI